MPQLSMLDVAKRNSSDKIVGLIEEVSTSAPEAAVVPARTIRGTTYQTLHRTALPTAAFRNANGGIATSKSTYELRTVQTFILDSAIVVDKAVALASEDGADAMLTDEAMGATQAALIKFGSQFYYGDVEVSGFPGLQSLYDTTNMELDAGGTTASTGSSVYAVRFGVKDVQVIFGNNTGFEMSDFRVESAEDSNGNSYAAYKSELTSWVGLQATNKTAIGRLKDITADSGKTLDDGLLFQLVNLFPAGQRPNALFMSKRSLAQLHGSRTATNPTGAPAPIPDSAYGIPIIVTDSLIDTEALS